MVPSLSVVIPVYNASLTLPDLISQLDSVLPALTGTYEVILVNDGSRDQSWETICSLAERYSWVRGINLMRNYGQHNALLCGIRAARYEIAVTMDDDLQHPPQEISKLLTKLAEGYDVVYGTPIDEQHGLWRDLASQITKLVLQTAMGAQNARKVSAFRAFRSEIRQAFANYGGSFVMIDVLLTWGTTRFASTPVRVEARRQGKSNYTFSKLITLAFNLLTGFSILPLQLASILGFASMFFGLCVLLYVVGFYIINGGSVPGFPFLASIIAIFSGVQLFALGIIGEYLGRLFNRSLDQPAYTIRSQAYGLSVDKEPPADDKRSN
jgi:glycosyltransferase involved in cell wall biosynthesis